ncbi:MAG: nuclear transport factor 2 family protein [Acidisphaera sp.]|nr:nuclear transport factor 2 family protein [Acidisphaera sp.]
MFDPQRLADRYAALWNETDTERRRAEIRELWTPSGEHYVNAREVRGYAALEERVTGSHHKNVRDNGNRFRAVQDARALRDIVFFHWEMLPADREEVTASGMIILRVDAEGRILVDYQFVF